MKTVLYGLCAAMVGVVLLSGCGQGKGTTKAKPRKPGEVLVERLGISDEASISEIYRLLESAVWRQYGVADTSRKRDGIYDRVAEKVADGKRPSEADVAKMLENAHESSQARNKRKTEDEAKGVVHLLPHESLEKAWDILRAARPELDGYEGRKLVAEALHEIWPYSSSLYFKRLSVLVPPDNFAPPAVDPKYEHFFTIKGYAGDPVFNELLKVQDEDLPAGAALPLLSLRRVPDTGMKRDGYGDMTDDALIKRYDERMLPALIEYLSNPQKYGEEDTGYPPTHVLAIARNWSDEAKAVLQRQAFLSGWDDACRMLEGPYTPALLEEFKDSPYGAPDRP